VENRPNIILILVDDMGFSDLGCFGGEIATPNLDRLAANGQTYTQFSNTARCCPSRACMLTGLHPHQTGIGHMTNVPANPKSYDKGLYGYRGFLNRNCVTMAEALRLAGYHTYMSGKWHLGMHAPDQLPNQRGFEQFYGIYAGACNYLRPTHPRGLWRNNDPVEPKAPFYSTDAFTDAAIEMIENQKDSAPFFLYLAYNAPHWPLQAPPEDVARYRGKYLAGWDRLREERYRRLVEKGIVPRKGCALSPRDPQVRAWDTLNSAQKDEMDLRMATYAAQVDRMDQNVGRLTRFLRESGREENTVLLFLSDNGGCAEGGELGHGAPEQINSPDIEGLMVSYGRAWANLSNTPYRLYKHYVHQGGIATPFIAYWPKGVQAGTRVDWPAYLPDLMPTVLELAGADYPRQMEGRAIPPLEGQSLAPWFQQPDRRMERTMFWEHEENCAVRRGNYKALQRYDTGEWELYDLDADRSELHNIAGEHPETMRALSEEWHAWADTHHVVPKPSPDQWEHP
jgi:arylsulfatase A-like enzyme